MNASPEPPPPQPPPAPSSHRLAKTGAIIGAIVVVTGLCINGLYIWKVWSGLDSLSAGDAQSSPSDLAALFAPIHYSEMVAIGFTLAGLVVLAVSLWALPPKPKKNGK